jgi:hypothetical protein
VSVTGQVGKKAIEALLDLAESARIARAKQMGFDTDRTWYHGTSSEFDEFDPSMGGRTYGIDDDKGLVYFSSSPEEAMYSAHESAGNIGGDPRLVQTFLKFKNPMVVDSKNTSPTNYLDAKKGQLKYDLEFKTDDDGTPYDGIIVRNSKTGEEVAVTAYPENIRDTRAAFDPEKEDSPKLMAATVPAAVGIGTLAAGAPDKSYADSKMTNPFDQFDQLPTAPNPFDQFDNEAPAPVTQMQGGGRSANAARLKAKNDEQLQSFRDQSAQSGIPLARDLPEIGSAPEMNALNLPALKASAGALTTFGDKEVGDILTKQVGAKVVQDAEGNYIATMPDGKQYSINKPDFSGQDAAKLAAGAAIFSPAGAIRNVVGSALGGMATQGAIEVGQKALGGEINPGEIAMAGAAPLAISGISAAARGAKSLSGRTSTVNQYLDDMLKAPAGGADDAAKAMESTSQAAPRSIFPESAKKSTVRQGIKEGTVEAVGFKLDPKGRVVADPVQRSLIKKGVSDKMLATTNVMTKGDKQASIKMLNKAEAFIRGVKGSEIDRPQSVIGENAMKRFDVIKGAQQNASKKIGEAVQNELKDVPADISPAVDNFIDAIEALGVKVEGDRLNFKESLIRGSNTTPIKNIFEMVKANYDDAAELHRVKQAITNQINYESIAKAPLDREAERALKGLRAAINDKLRTMSKGYASANDEYAKAAEAINPFMTAIGRKFDPESTRIDSVVGQELRKTITNYAKSNELIESINALDVAAKGFGGKFDDDLMTQVMLNSELERVFGSFAPGSMQGVIEKGVGSVANRYLGPAGPAATAGFNAAKDRVMFAPPSKEKLELIKELRELLSR